jgi:hypothetical protein
MSALTLPVETNDIPTANAKAAKAMVVALIVRIAGILHYVRSSRETSSLSTQRNTGMQHFVPKKDISQHTGDGQVAVFCGSKHN